MRQSEPISRPAPQVSVFRGRLEWPGRHYPVAHAFSDEPGHLKRIRNNGVLITVFLYLLFNWGFQQVRFPPVAGGGLPVAELVLFLALLTINPHRALGRLATQVYLLPMILWWVFGVGRALVDISVYGFWALRDAAHVIESMFLIVGFSFAAYPSTVERFFVWLPRFLIIAVIYGMLYPFREIFLNVSPSIISANGYNVPIVGSMANTSFLLIMAASYLFLYKGRSLFFLLLATLLIGYTLAIFQARTLYLLMIALLGFFWLFGRLQLIHVLLAISILGLMLAVIMLLDLRVQGRLGEELSPEFLVHHFLAIFGISSGTFDGVAAAAAGVDQRLGWWNEIMRKMMIDPFKLLLGLGYGIALTDFYGSGGAAVREPHNSYITLLARTGFIGATCWLLMMASLVHRWFLTFRLCKKLGFRTGENRLMILMVFFVCMWVLAIGEDGFEKPYNIIPFYFLWGVVIGFGLSLSRGRFNIGGDGAPQDKSSDWVPRKTIQRWA